MSAAAAHAVQAAAALEQPDMFSRLAFVVTEIDRALLDAVAQLVKLKGARVEHDPKAMAEACADIAQHLNQAAQLVAVTSRVVSGGH